MDSSTKANQDTKIGLVMGTMKVSGLKTEDLAQIIQNVLGLCKSHLKYLSGFEPISSLLNHNVGNSGYDRRITDENIVNFPQRINQKTLCIVIAELDFNVGNELSPGFGVAYFTETELLLLRNGDLLIWKAKYLRNQRSGLGYREHRTGIDEIAEFSVFSKVKTLSEIEKLLEQQSNLASLIIEKLLDATQKTIRKRRQTLQSFEHLEDRLVEILNRI